ncbi:MAG: IseA DL-endopeptidase inhibitor family protein [Firmicutes bacterium]|nr:IseA DL-endopeptidase inhibitor family protein [[Eubacterium] siraeum]MCM1488110.1 IseA DL-endopeptidase inhibitor family protein [Bacillota bacterium]
MKKMLSSLATLLMLAAVSGCNGQGDNPSDTATAFNGISSNTDDLTEETSSAADESEFETADKCVLGIKSLFNDYRWKSFDDTAIKIKISELGTDINGETYLSVTDGKIKTCGDIKEKFTEYCTEEFADRLIADVFCYEEADGGLYYRYYNQSNTATDNYCDTYIESCQALGDNMKISLTAAKDPDYNYNEIADHNFTMELAKENGKWLVSDISPIDGIYYIGYLYKTEEIEAPAETEETISEFPPEDVDCIKTADEYARALQKLYMKYLQNDEKELAFKLDDDPAKGVFFRGFTAYPIIGGEIKTYDDFKSLFTEWCTDEFAEELLKKSLYGNVEGKLYKSHAETPNIGTIYSVGYINDCQIDKNKMYVQFTAVGTDNELFDPADVSDRSPAEDECFTMELVWKNGEWLIADCTNSDVLAFTYSSELTMSMNGGLNY